MKPQKMHEVELADVLAREQAGTLTDTERVLLAHSRAVVVERDELGRFKAYVHERLDAAGVPTHPDGPHSKAGCRIGDRLDVLIAERDALRERVSDLAGQCVKAEQERDGLRERVQALEKDTATWHHMKAVAEANGFASLTDAITRAAKAESRLAAIRQRVGDREDLGAIVCDWLHQRTEGGGPGSSFADCGVRVARYVLGEDEAGTGRDLLHPTGRCTCAGEGTCDWCSRVCCAGCGKEGVDLCPKAREAVPLLERRMGALVKWRERLEEVLPPGVVIGYLSAHPPHTREAGAQPLMLSWDALKKLGALFNEPALTGASPVFTLEEVEWATTPPTWSDDVPTEHGAGYREGFEKALQAVRKRLSALRK